MFGIVTRRSSSGVFGSRGIFSLSSSKASWSIKERILALGPSETNLQKTDIEHLMSLCKVSIPEEQVPNLHRDVTQVLHSLKMIQQVETEGIQPLVNVLDSCSELRLREDDEQDEMPELDNLFSNAKVTLGRFYVVPKVK
eukprot:TRINITY_DN15605_c0_g1_i1.p1 TRINITY_DN15605_c0_g1~~TRINITY_DN15605_c0_g1_i1.p1  ORF type:complete len:140 (+),score=34.15 TRINITY_DN15605_c0_g1_i1:62-481(+)